MAWLWAKFDRLCGTVIAAVTGAAASQIQAFIAAYLQRLGGHLDEARRMVERLRNGGFSPDVDIASQDRLAAAIGRRVGDLATAHDAIAGADAFSRPFAFLTHMDSAIAEATLTSFTPALPLDSPSLAYALVGIVLGWLLYELATLPIRLMAGRRATY